MSGRPRDLPDLVLCLAVVDRLHDLVVLLLPQIILGQRVYAVIASQVLKFVLFSRPQLLSQLPLGIVYLFFKRLLLKETLVLHVMHVLEYLAFLLD
jgi:hypothetical protein